MSRATVFTAALLILGSAISTPAQEPSLAHKGRVVIPESAIERPEDVGFVRTRPTKFLCPRIGLSLELSPMAMPCPTLLWLRIRLLSPVMASRHQLRLPVSITW